MPSTTVALDAIMALVDEEKAGRGAKRARTSSSTTATTAPAPQPLGAPGRGADERMERGASHLRAGMACGFNVDEWEEQGAMDCATDQAGAASGSVYEHRRRMNASIGIHGFSEDLTWLPTAAGNGV